MRDVQHLFACWRTSRPRSDGETFLMNDELNKNFDFDVIIIGGGAAGISSALWCEELGLKTLLLEENDELGGQLLRIFNSIENYLGAKAKNGRELRDIFVRQIENRNFSIKLSSAISEVNLENKTILFKDSERIFAKALIIATGVRRRSLDVEGEKRFQKRELSNRASAT